MLRAKTVPSARKNKPRQAKYQLKDLKKGERLFLGISLPQTTSIGGKKNWLLVLDDCTDLAWSYFLKNKSNLKDEILALIKELKAKFGITVKYIRCDNAGENIALEKACEQEGLGITFKYTAPNTPQQNGRVERKFSTLYGRMHVMMRGSGLRGLIRQRLWAEAAKTATDLSKILVKKQESQSLFQMFFGKGVKSKILST